MAQAGKTGKLAPVIDQRTLKAATYMLPLSSVPAPSPSADWRDKVQNFGMACNGPDPAAPACIAATGVGCCVESAMDHATQIATVNAGPAEVTVTDADVIAAYSTISGYQLCNEATDQGSDMLAACKYWQSAGIEGHKIAAYATVAWANHTEVEQVIDLFGVLYIGVQLPESAEQQFNAGQPWEVVTPDGGSAGGHCIIAVGYNATGPIIITWGSAVQTTWAWWDKYLDEAYLVVLDDWIEANGSSPSGFNLAALLADVAALTGAPTPAPFVPSPATVQWLQWQVADVTWIAGEYAAGNVTAAQAGQALVVSNAAYVAGLLAGTAQPKAVPQ